MHTRELPHQNRTTDLEINKISLNEKRILITKDNDFLDSFLLHHEPHKLVLVRTGNLQLAQMNHLFNALADSLLNALEDSSLIEVYQEEILIIF